MTRKQALCGLISRYPGIPLNAVQLVQISTIYSRQHTVDQTVFLKVYPNNNSIECVGTGKTIQEAFDHCVSNAKKLKTIEKGYGDYEN